MKDRAAGQGTGILRGSTEMQSASSPCEVLRISVYSITLGTDVAWQRTPKLTRHGEGGTAVRDHDQAH